MASFLDLNDNCISLNSLFDKIDQSFVNDAVVNVTIKDSDGAILVNAQAMPYVASSDGVYRAVIASTEDLGDDGDIVSVEVNAVAADSSVYQARDEAVYIKGRGLSGAC